MKSNRMVLIGLMVTLGSGALAYYLPEPYRSRTLWGGTGGAKGPKFRALNAIAPITLVTDNASRNLPPMRFFIGTGVAFFFISAVGEFQPSLAGPFAALVGTTALLFNGAPALDYFINGGGAEKPPIQSASPNANPDPTLIAQAVFDAFPQPTPEPATTRSPHITKPRTATIVVPGTQGKKLRLAAN